MIDINIYPHLAVEGFWILANIAMGNNSEVDKLINKNLIGSYEKNLPTNHTKIFD